MPAACTAKKTAPFAEGTVLTFGYSENTAGVSVRFSRDYFLYHLSYEAAASRPPKEFGLKQLHRRIDQAL
ncbi:hypothetical protein BK138_18430 [Paenibacillus rhizosphaerae]|uniref:Uncharacterized protein n=1 Tax=Paenibacillus rhizosphaerae TaxID=297318 RepID=A0A1R1EPN0_9BACL|nr:hypothetical protein BK138_18430 [Paenibacillus rhizosphaerae]